VTKPIILFILKRRPDYNPAKHSPLGLSTGLFNSASFVKDMLIDMGFDARLEVAIDNNCIDRLVTKHKPTHVIIEAIWVVPTKFHILTRLHPNVKWIIRLHSEMPFIAGEGMAMDWLGDYMDYPQIDLAINAPRMLKEIRTFIQIAKDWTDKQTKERIYYLPNYYPQGYKVKKHRKDLPYIDVACFGAVRPLKNHLLQAVAALAFAKKINKVLRFHINAGRIEMQGQPAMNNLVGLFQHLHEHGHTLIAHEWTPREQFLEICAEMDIGMQCNFSETFNIVSADLISQGVPIVGSSEIPWASKDFNARATEHDEIVHALISAYTTPRWNVWKNQRNLTKYTNKTKKIWRKHFKSKGFSWTFFRKKK
jgi:hypothetical protein